MPNEAVAATCILIWLAIGWILATMWVVRRNTVSARWPYIVSLGIMGPFGLLLFLIE